MNQTEDAALIARAVNEQDQRAYTELVARHQSNLRYSMRQLTDWNEALADDLVQEAFIQAFRQLKQFRGDAKFSSWLYRIAYNVFLQQARKKQLLMQSLDSHPVLDTPQEPVANAKSSIDEAEAEQSALHKKVASLLAELEPERRSVLHLLLHRQHTQQEIATIMGIPLGSVKTHINRGRAGLQKALKAWQEQ